MVLYSAGWLVALAKLVQYLAERNADLRLTDRLFCWLLFCIPLGKLMYGHLPGLVGLKISFVAWSVVGGLLCTWAILTQSVRNDSLGLLALLLVFPLLSLMLLDNPYGILVYTSDDQTDSLLARAVSLFLLVLFMLSVRYHCERLGVQRVVRSFFDGVIATAVIGTVIFILVYSGQVGVDELLPISADTHIVSLVYRFNPGGNVNEFGIVAVYAMMLLRIAYPSISRSRLVFCYSLLVFGLFFSLTRAAWLAFIAALLVGVAVGGRGRGYLIASGVLVPLFVGLIYLINDEFAELVTSRLAFQGGASGDERIEKVMTAFLSGDLHWFNYLFGSGWATNLYMHSVPLQLLYETGLAGFLTMTLLLIALLISLTRLALRKTDPLPMAALACIAAFTLFSAFHHTIYHMQTWFILGIGLYAAGRKLGENRSTSWTQSSLGRTSP